MSINCAQFFGYVIIRWHFCEINVTCECAHCALPFSLHTFLDRYFYNVNFFRVYFDFYVVISWQLLFIMLGEFFSSIISRQPDPGHNRIKVKIMPQFTQLYKGGQQLCSPVPMFPEPMFPGTDVPRYRCSPIFVL